MKFVKSLLSFLLIFSLTSNTYVVEAKTKDSQGLETVYATAQNGEEVKIDNYDTSIIFTYLRSGNTEKLEFIDECNAVYYSADGNTHTLFIDPNGNIYYDDKLVATSDENTQSSKQIDEITVNYIPDPDPISSYWGSDWSYLSTRYSNQKVYDDVGNIAMGIIGLVPGLGVYVFMASLAAIVLNIASSQYQIMYYKIEQFISSNQHYVRERVWITKYSSYNYFSGYVDTAPRSIF